MEDKYGGEEIDVTAALLNCIEQQVNSKSNFQLHQERRLSNLKSNASDHSNQISTIKTKMQEIGVVDADGKLTDLYK